MIEPNRDECRRSGRRRSKINRCQWLPIVSTDLFRLIAKVRSMGYAGEMMALNSIEVC